MQKSMPSSSSFNLLTASCFLSAIKFVGPQICPESVRDNAKAQILCRTAARGLFMFHHESQNVIAHLDVYGMGDVRVELELGVQAGLLIKRFDGVPSVYRLLPEQGQHDRAVLVVVRI